ncbi:MAG: Fe-S-containing hydro-lyase [Clostridiaceae bacterium]|nr:Fe-S-containing hydro-lyase [Clostridiaceae bacterium]
MARIRINLPMTAEQASELHAGDLLLLTGVIYTARDAAHKRLVQCLQDGKPLPVDFNGQTIYYAGPCPARPGRIIGSAGPTTSGRMDAYAPLLLQQGLRVMIGKGQRQPAVIDAMKKYGAVYLGATGGAGALLAQCVKEAEIVAYPDLGPEAIRRLTVEQFPVVVLIDSRGNNLYQTGRQAYRR